MSSAVSDYRGVQETFPLDIVQRSVSDGMLNSWRSDESESSQQAFA